MYAIAFLPGLGRYASSVEGRWHMLGAEARTVYPGYIPKVLPWVMG
jgi:hypothetical protein